MNKEELINLINSLTIEEINAFKIQYYSEKRRKNMGIHMIKEKKKEISFGCDFSQLYMQKFDKLNDKMSDLQNQLYEMRNSNEYNKQ